MYDVVIIGAGPAGATLARLLDKNLKVMIIDKRNLGDEEDTARDKCCGGLLAPAAQKALARQGLGVPSSIMESPQTFSVQSVDLDNNITKYYQRHYININRGKFDRWLVSLIPDTVEKQFGRIYKEYEKNEVGYTAITEKDGVVKRIETKVLIGADGALSRVRTQAFEDKHMPLEYVSIQEHFPAGKTLPYYVSIFDAEVTDFYSWVIQKDGEFLVGTAVPEQYDANEKFELLANKLRDKGYITGKSVKRTGTLVMRPMKGNHLKIHKESIALAGEAAGLISPSSAEGISYALVSGRILADSINLGISNYTARYNKGLLGLKLNLKYKRLKVLLMYNKFTRRIIMKTGVLSMKVEGHDD